MSGQWRNGGHCENFGFVHLQDATITITVKFFAKNFVFVVGFLFIFVFGFLYAYVKPEGLLFNGIFLLIILGWVIFIIKYFWELMDKDREK